MEEIRKREAEDRLRQEEERRRQEEDRTKREAEEKVLYSIFLRAVLLDYYNRALRELNCCCCICFLKYFKGTLLLLDHIKYKYMQVLLSISSGTVRFRNDLFFPPCIPPKIQKCSCTVLKAPFKCVVFQSIFCL